MTQQPDHPTGHQDGSTSAEQPPSEVLTGYPPEAAPAADDGTEAVAVPGEQTDPDRRLDVFPEDDRPATAD
ncbi:hypothetical protein [Aquipuribacter sp. MA13-6]|uniref:hypothetical protein n=1 Tax=unclassified Aquipuribacter TaxID=2635084 RepID=UPI003EEE2411